MPIDRAAMDEDFDPLDDYALYEADDTFTVWDDDVAARLKPMLYALEVSRPWLPKPESSAKIPARSIEYTGPLNEICERIARWVDGMPARLAKLLAHPVLHPLFPAPDLIFLIHLRTGYCTIQPHFLNYPANRHEGTHLFIDFSHVTYRIYRIDERNGFQPADALLPYGH